MMPTMAYSIQYINFSEKVSKLSTFNSQLRTKKDWLQPLFGPFHVEF